MRILGLIEKLYEFNVPLHMTYLAHYVCSSYFLIDLSKSMPSGRTVSRCMLFSYPKNFESFANFCINNAFAFESFRSFVAYEIGFEKFAVFGASRSLPFFALRDVCANPNYCITRNFVYKNFLGLVKTMVGILERA